MEKSKNPPKKKEFDRLQNLKFKGYCWANTPPGEDTTLEDLVSFAKFYLCKELSRLWKDEIWNDYTDEEILIEYFAHLFSKDKTAKQEFEVELNAGEDVYGEDVYDWLDRMIAKNQEEMREKLDKLPEKISFSPERNEDKEE